MENSSNLPKGGPGNLRQKFPETCKDRLERLEVGVILLLQDQLARFSRTRALLKACCVAAACRRIIPEALAVWLIGSKLLRRA